MKIGTQIVYTPMHANGDFNHPDVEHGFVTSERGDTVFCRYWSKHSPGELRTRVNSEGAHKSLIHEHWFCAQRRVNNELAKIDAGGVA